MIKKISMLAISLMASVSAFAAPQTYVVDPSHTFAKFSYNHLGYSTQLSRFDKTSGTVIFDSVAKTGSVDIVIDMKSVNTGFPLFNEHIQGKDFLDTAKYPTATFKSSNVVFSGNKPSEVHGDLTIKGVTKHVTLKVHNFLANEHPMMKKEAIGADASVVIKRSDFNAGMYAPNVSDEVTITVSLEALKK